MFKVLVRGLAGVAVFLVSYIALGGVMSAASAPRPRGEMVQIEPGRSLRLVCEGSRSDRPVVWLEAGAFGFAADWGATQEALTAAGWRSCAYDRAGMGYSPPGPAPRDGLAIVSDFEKLTAASGEGYDIIVSEVAVPGRPEAWLKALSVGGRLAEHAGPPRLQAPRQAGEPGDRLRPGDVHCAHSTPRGWEARPFRRMGRHTAVPGRAGWPKAARDLRDRPDRAGCD